MPVEIKELVIRAVVNSPEPRAADAASASAPEAADHERAAGPERDAVVEAAVKEVLRILRASKER